LDKKELDAKVEEIAKALLSYCAARTSNYFEAEDLAID
jgi:DNA-directed RNA polymerase specialized sigma24 family protein